MQVTKELVENDIKGMEAEFEQLKARVAQAAGALNVLKNMRDYLDKPEPEVKQEEVVVTKVVPENNTGIITENQVGDNKIVDGQGKYNAVADMETV